MAKIHWYSSDVARWYIIQHIFDFSSSCLIFGLFIWQIYSSYLNRSSFRRNTFSQMFNDSSPDSSFTHIVHRLGFFLSIIYVVRSIDPFGLLGILSFEVLVFISNNLILTYLIYGILLIYAPISAHYYHQRKSRIITTVSFVTLVISVTAFTEFSSYMIFQENPKFWSDAFIIFWLSFALVICFFLLCLLQYVYKILEEMKENEAQTTGRTGAFEENSKLDYQLRNMIKMRFSVVFLLLMLIPQVYLISTGSHHFYEPTTGENFDIVADGFSCWGRLVLLAIILYQSWIPPVYCCFWKQDVRNDAPLLSINATKNTVKFNSPISNDVENAGKRNSHVRDIRTFPTYKRSAFS